MWRVSRPTTMVPAGQLPDPAPKRTHDTKCWYDVERLEFDAWEEILPGVLEGLAEQAVEKFGVRSVVMGHRTGSVQPSEPIVCIHVGSVHRAEGFSACSWLISELKNQAPLWKKEVREDGEIWKAGLG